MSFSGHNDSIASTFDDFNRSYEDLSAPFPLKREAPSLSQGSSHSDGMFSITPLQLMRSISGSNGKVPGLSTNIHPNSRQFQHLLSDDLALSSMSSHPHSHSSLYFRSQGQVQGHGYNNHSHDHGHAYGYGYSNTPKNRLQMMHSMPFDDDCLDCSLPIAINNTTTTVDAIVDPRTCRHGSAPVPLIPVNNDDVTVNGNNGNGNGNRNRYASDDGLALQSSLPQLYHSPGSRSLSHRSQGTAGSSVSSLPQPIHTTRSRSVASHASVSNYQYSSCDDYQSDAYCSEEDSQFGSHPGAGYPAHSVYDGPRSMHVRNVNVAPSASANANAASANANAASASASASASGMPDRLHQRTAVFGYNTGAKNSAGASSSANTGAKVNGNIGSVEEEQAEEGEDRVAESSGNSNTNVARVRTKRGRAVYNRRYEGYDCSGAAAVAHLSVHANELKSEDEEESLQGPSSSSASAASSPGSGSFLSDMDHIKERIEKTKNMEHLATRVALTNDEIRLSRKEKRRILNQRRRDRLSEGYVKLRELCDMSEKTTTVETMDTAIATIIALQSYCKQLEEERLAAKKKRTASQALASADADASTGADATVTAAEAEETAGKGRGRKRRKTSTAAATTSLY